MCACEEVSCGVVGDVAVCGQVGEVSGEIRDLYELRKMECPDLSCASVVRALRGKSCSEEWMCGACALRVVL